jgi:uncharacterized protein (TIGR02145 family)/uncharacterized repeat protein (TIGR02059 family)
MMIYRKTYYQLSLIIGILMIFNIYFIFSCEKLEPERIMKIQTDSVTNITSNSCTLWGTIIDLGDKASQYGHCYAKTSNVNVSNTKTTFGKPIVKGSFTSKINDLESDSKYYIKTYLSDGDEGVYGREISFTTLPPAIPVYVSSVVENATPTILEMTYSLTLANVVPATSAFTVTVNSVSRTVNSVVVSGTKVQLTISSAIVNGDIVTVAYTKPATNPLQTLAGGQAASITVHSVTNNVGPAIPVYVSSIVENSTPTIIEMTFSFSLANIVPATSAFTVTVNSVSRTVNSVVVSGTKVQLTISSAIVNGDIVTVAYTKPATNPLQTLAGGQAASITAQSVTNIVGAVIPIYVSSVVESAAPTILEMTYSLSLANIVPATSAFNVKVNSVNRTVNEVSINGTKVQLTLSNAIVYGDIVTVAYTKPATNPLQTSAGGQAASITAQSVTNNVGPAIPVYVSSVVENATPTIIEMTYSLPLANVVPATSAFTVTVNSVNWTVSGVGINGTKVQLTLSSAIVYGDIVKVAYTKPATNPLQTSAGGQAESITAQNVTNNVGLASPVYVSSIVENATPTLIEITYSLSLTNVVPAPSAFTVTVNSVNRTISGVGINGTKVQLTLSSAIVYGDIVTVAYTKPATNPLQTSAGGQAGSFAAQGITNNVAQIPVYVSSIVENATPTILEMNYSLALANIVPATSAFTVMVNSVNRTISGVGINGTKVQLTLSNAIVYGDIVTVAYTKPATNPLQTASGGQAASITAQSVTNNVSAPGTVNDNDGNVYNTIVIGTQEWLRENLRTSKYNDGSSIPLVTDNTAWSNLITPGYCWSNNDAATYKATYGALYNWYTVNTGKLCPTGWHIPSDAEWTTLTTYLGGENVAGGKLKETGTAHWYSPNAGATNETNFTALPGGSRDFDGSFYGIGNYGDWWSSTESNTDIAWDWGMYYLDSNVYRDYYDKRDGFSVRCVRD